MQVSQLLTRLLVPPEAAVDATPSTDRADILNERLQRLKQRRQRRFVTRRLAIGAAIVFFLSFPLAIRLGYVFGESKEIRYFVGSGLLFCGVLFLAVAVAVPVWDSELEIRQTEDELDLLTDKDVTAEQRAQKLFKIHQYQLNKYYDQTLRISKWVFFVGVTCLVMGFLVVGASLWLVHGANAAKDQYVVAALGAIGGLLSNFIGAIYLKMHSKTIKSLTEFHNRLVLTHYLHFGNFLLAKIENQDLREKSLAQMALNLSTDQTHAQAAAAKAAPTNRHAAKTSAKNGAKARAEAQEA
jgi:hypothetical protein